MISASTIDKTKEKRWFQPLELFGAPRKLHGHPKWPKSPSRQGFMGFQHQSGSKYIEKLPIDRHRAAATSICVCAYVCVSACRCARFFSVPAIKLHKIAMPHLRHTFQICVPAERTCSSNLRKEERVASSHVISAKRRAAVWFNSAKRRVAVLQLEYYFCLCLTKEWLGMYEGMQHVSTQ